jgi:choline/glycine/proline betaine transport protein
VFIPSALVITCLVTFSSLAPNLAAEWFGGLKDSIVESFGWLFRGSVTLFLVLAVVLMSSRYGNLRLGKADDRPEFGRPTWFAMLFSAGMGIGLMFFGVAEPIMHLTAPPEGPADTAEAARAALGITMFHWGLHAWGVYALMGLALAYFSYRKGLPLAVRSILHPLLGDRIAGRWGDAIDVLAVLGTVFGLATSLGLGAKQINAGLSHLFEIPDSRTTHVVLISLITCAAAGSLLTGLQRGIRRLSELNLVLAATLLLGVFALGPTEHVLTHMPADLLAYGRRIVGSLAVGEQLGSDGWQASWSVFYWAWWIAWAPFVGTFVARISKGRTIREFVLGVLLVPTAVTMVWLLVFGETAVYLERRAHAGIADAVEANSAVAIYQVLEQLPLASVSCAVAVAAVTVFFVTSSDSGSFVVDMLTSGGHPDPPIWQRLFWAITEGVVAIVLLRAGGLGALQSAAVAMGLPFCLVLLLACVSLFKALRGETLTPARTSGG